MDKFDEYKFFTERVQHRSERRQQASQIYLTVNTAIFGVIALLIKDSGLHGWSLMIGVFPLFCVGILVCATGPESSVNLVKSLAGNMSN